MLTVYNNCIVFNVVYVRINSNKKRCENTQTEGNIFVMFSFQTISIHPSIHFLYLLIEGYGGLEPIPAATEQEAGYTLDTLPVYHRATQRQTTVHVHTHSQGQFSQQFNHQLSHMHIFFMVGGIWSTWREPTCTQGKHVNSTQKGPSRDLNQKPSCCEAMVLTTTQPLQTIY